MSFNRTKYDSTAYNLEINRSVGPGDYRLYGSFGENCNQCFSDFGPIGSKADVSLTKDLNDLTFGNMAVTESNLSWRSHKLSKDNCNPTIKNPPITHKKACSKVLTTEDTRFTHPIDNYRSMSLTSYQYEPYLPVNPQCHIQDIDDRVGLNSRLYSKDMYILHDQNPWDDGSAFPKPTPDKLKICTNIYQC
jgi:hypothetical protein